MTTLVTRTQRPSGIASRQHAARAGFDIRIALVYLLALFPFIYSNDHSNTRAYEVVAVGSLFFLASLFPPFRLRREPEFVFIGFYSALLILQQYAIPGGSLRFGAQYALVMFSALIPAWLLRGVQWREQDIETHWDNAIQAIAIVLVASVLAARFLGLGELYIGRQDGRYFGFIGDSASPVFAFPLIYFLLTRRWLWAAALVGCMLLTGGKAAAIMLVVALGLIPLLRLNWFFRILSLPLLLAAGLYLTPLFVAFTGERAVQYSWNTRMLSYRLGWDMFLDHKLVGVGINQSMINLAPKAKNLAAAMDMDQYYIVTQIHNAFIRALAETGLLGFGALIFLCAILIWRAVSAVDATRTAASPRRRALVLSAAAWTIAFITTYQTTGWFEHGHPQFAWLLTISALAFAASRQAPGAVARRPVASWRRRAWAQTSSR